MGKRYQEKIGHTVEAVGNGGEEGGEEVGGGGTLGVEAFIAATTSSPLQLCWCLQGRVWYVYTVLEGSSGKAENNAMHARANSESQKV